MKVGIIGNGFVGKATAIIECKEIELLCYDINSDLCKPKGITLEDLLECEAIFISVPTPMNKDGSCYLKILESVVNQIKELKYRGFIVSRSTVPIGTSDNLGCYFMPEFLTEKNFQEDFINNSNWIFGLLGIENDNKFKVFITKLIDTAVNNNRIKYNRVTFMLNKEAEMVKLFRNCFLATKVAFCNEISEFCNNKSIDYGKVAQIACEDKRIGLSHISVPGPDGMRGYGGTCFPKDMNSLLYEIEKSNMTSYVIKAAVERNENADRPEQDWKNDKGRAAI